jgi:hypothetical protein
MSKSRRKGSIIVSVPAPCSSWYDGKVTRATGPERCATLLFGGFDSFDIMTDVVPSIAPVCALLAFATSLSVFPPRKTGLLVRLCACALRRSPTSPHPSTRACKQAHMHVLSPFVSSLEPSSRPLSGVQGEAVVKCRL